MLVHYSIKRFLLQAPLFICVGVFSLGACKSSPASQPEISPSPSSVPENSAVPPQLSPVETATPRATPGPQQELFPPFDIHAVQDSPLTDPIEILRILESLQQREEAWFSRPGWYQVTVDYETDEFGNDVYLTHVINDQRECRERLYYFNKQGQIWPYIIRLEDGTTASYNPVFEGKFRQDMVQPASLAVHCDLGNGESIWVGTEEADFILHDEALHFSLPDSSNLDPELVTQIDRGWVEQISSGDAFVWEREFVYLYPSPSVSGVFVDPATGAEQTINRKLERVYVDLLTGLQMKTETDFYLVNGSAIDGSHATLNQYEYWEMLPEHLAEVYENMAADLRRVLEK